MQRSPSTQWSGSAGAIYPLMRRLKRQGLLAARVDRVGRRPRMLYRVTPAGLTVLRSWIGPPLAPDVVTVSYDPLRSRARFLAALPPRERRRWVDAASVALAEVERRVRDWQPPDPKTDDAFLTLLTRHAELEVQARRQWLALVRGALAPRRMARKSEPTAPARRSHR